MTQKYERIYVSIHAPAWGATSDDPVSLSLTVRFNPRARVGRDDVDILYPPPQHVSIHAPAWGATLQVYARSTCRPSFNPRARVGRDSNADDLNLL